MCAGPRLASSRQANRIDAQETAPEHHRSNQIYTNTIGNVSIARQRDNRAAAREPEILTAICDV